MSNKHTVPPYSEADATAWLAWLAYNMRRREMTIFQIESLQPDWLAGWKETTPHLLLTRILWGVFAGLIFGLFGVLFVELNDALIIGLIIGLIVGLIVGLIEMVIPIHKIDAALRTNTGISQVWGIVAWTLSIGLSIGLILALILMLSGGPSSWLSLGLSLELRILLITTLMFGLTIGLIFGLVRTARVTQREVGKGIRTIESVRWSWQNVYSDEVNSTIFVLVFGLIGSLIISRSGVPIIGRGGLLYNGKIGGMIRALIGSLTGWLISWLISGFQTGVEDLKTRPNQGIWLTLRSVFKMGGLAGLITGILVGLLSQSIAVGLGYCSVIFLVIGGWYGGLDAIEHCIVRFILAMRGHAPLNYARFLDYAAEELNFLQKVGGGYIFIHRYLLEHFAEIAVEKGLVPEEKKQQ